MKQSALSWKALLGSACAIHRKNNHVNEKSKQSDGKRANHVTCAKGGGGGGGTKSDYTLFQVLIGGINFFRHLGGASVKERNTTGQFNETFSSVIYKCSHCFRG